MAFRKADRKEREGDLSGAKAHRLELAKLVAIEKGLEWPKDLSDSEAADLIWTAHSSKPPIRGGGFSGTRAYFSFYLSGRNEPVKKRFGSALAKELLRRGVLGDEASFLSAIGQSPRNGLPRLVMADWLDEHERPASAEVLRLSDERNWTADKARISELEARIDVLRSAALSEWNEGEAGQKLAAAGKFVSLTREGLPVFRPRNFTALYELTAEQAQLIVGLEVVPNIFRLTDNQRRIVAQAVRAMVDSIPVVGNRTGYVSETSTVFVDEILRGFGGPPSGNAPRSTDANASPLDVTRLVALDLRNVIHLNIQANQIGDAGLEQLAGSASPFKNLTWLALQLSLLTDAGLPYLRSPTLKHVTHLNLSRNHLSEAGIAGLHGPPSPYIELITDRQMP